MKTNVFLSPTGMRCATSTLNSDGHTRTTRERCPSRRALRLGPASQALPPLRPVAVALRIPPSLSGASHASQRPRRKRGPFITAPRCSGKVTKLSYARKKCPLKKIRGAVRRPRALRGRGPGRGVWSRGPAPPALARPSSLPRGAAGRSVTNESAPIFFFGSS